MNPFKGPVVRDLTPNPPKEMLRRLAFVIMAAGGILGPLTLAGSWARRHETGLIIGIALTSLALLLLATRRWWDRPPANPARPIPPAPPAHEHAASPTATTPLRPRILVLNASLAGPEGNTARALDRLAALLATGAEVERAHLAGPGARDFAALSPTLRTADAFVIGTGVHWDSWSSTLQKFLEDATPAEVTDLWLGKPAAVIVTEHSVGGKAVLSRLQGVLVTLGCTLPPLSGLVLSQTAQIARSATKLSAAADELWSPQDLSVVAHNLLLAVVRRAPATAWRTWPVDRADYATVWWRD